MVIVMKRYIFRAFAFLLAALMILPIGTAAADLCTDPKMTVLLIPRSSSCLAALAAGKNLPTDQFALTAEGRTARKMADLLLDRVMDHASAAAHCIGEKARWTAALVGLAAEVDIADIPYLRAAGDLAPEGEKFDLYSPAMYSSAALTGDRAEDSDTSLTPEVILNITEEVLSLDGEGTVIAVIDTGFDADMSAFTLPEKIDASLSGNTLAARLSLIGRKSADEGQDKRKIPFLFNYVSPSSSAETLAVHGTRTAALAAGYTGNEFDGTAPGAQLLLMKVFGENEEESAREDVILSAIDDALLLGADVINLSLVSPFVGHDGGVGLTLAIGAAKKAGVGVVAPVGNYGELGTNSFFYNRTGAALFPAEHTDRGTVSHPASIEGVIAVGAAVGSYLSDYVMLDEAENRIAYTDTCKTYFRPADADSDTDEDDLARARDFASLVGGKSITYVTVPGVGKQEDYAELDVRGCVALVERGEISFIEKTVHAKEAGAIGVIVYDNDPETDGRVNMQLDDAPLPAVFISIEDGKRLSAALRGTLTFPERDSSTRGMTVYDIAPFSSRGMRDDFSFAPTLSAPGSNFIGLSVDAKLSLLEGTSYAAAQVSGALATLIGRIRAEQTKKSAPEMLSDAVTLLQNTANPLLLGNLSLSLRAQGAGSMNVNAAKSSPLLLRGDDGGSLTLTGEDSEFTLTFTAENRTDRSLTIHLPLPVFLADETDNPLKGENPDELTEAAVRWLSLNGYSYENLPFCLTGMRRQISADIRLNGLPMGEKGSNITLSPGESRKITLSVSLDRNEYDAHAARFPSGFPIECMLEAEADGHTLSLPAAVYCGDWTAAPITAGTAYDDQPNLYQNQILSAYMRSGYTVNFGEMYGSDIIRNMAEFSSPLACFNPNGLADPLSLTLCLLRNVRCYTVSVKNADGREVYHRDGGALRKSHTYNGSAVAELIELWHGRVTDNDKFICPDGIYTIALTLHGTAGGEQTITLPVTLDTTAPTIKSAEFVRDEGGNLLLAITAEDAEYIRSVEVSDKRGYIDHDRTIMESPAVLERGRGTPLTLYFDANDLYQQYFYVTLTDYAYNQSVIRVDRDLLFAAFAESESGK